MGDCTIDKKWVENPTYEDVKSIYECFNMALSQMPCRSSNIDFYFKCGNIKYTAQSIEEFTEIAFVEEKFDLISLSLMGFLKKDEYVRIGYLCGLHISASSKVLLEDFISKLELGKYFDNMGENNTANVGNSTINHQQNNIPNGNITVTGNGNTIINNNISGANNSIGNSNVTTEPKEETEHKSWLNTVKDTIIGNLGWTIFVTIVAAILLWLGVDL